jgi:hypothetical protein
MQRASAGHPHSRRNPRRGPAGRGSQISGTKKASRNIRNIFQPHEICVWDSAKQQLRLISDRSLAIENAFLACFTEEQRMRSYLGVLSLGPGMADAFVANANWN